MTFFSRLFHRRSSLDPEAGPQHPAKSARSGTAHHFQALAQINLIYFERKIKHLEQQLLEQASSEGSSGGLHGLIEHMKDNPAALALGIDGIIKDSSQKADEFQITFQKLGELLHKYSMDFFKLKKLFRPKLELEFFLIDYLSADQAVLQQRELERLQHFPLETGKGKERESNSFQLEEYTVSLDGCECCKPCKNSLFWYLTLRESFEDPKELFYKLFVALLLAFLPTASILVLFAIPSTYGRLGAIVGESGIMILYLALTKSVQKEQSATYLLGAIQVVFVGSTISNS
ncbi:hypothetical protein F4802DRAFT_191062 [Xylaria palmicola]|nr:hypothetical protein F4802DRAFT_191062 [Xylaria palmicola]